MEEKNATKKKKYVDATFVTQYVYNGIDGKENKI